MPRRPSRYEDFEIAIICTKKDQFDAIRFLFDESLHSYGEENEISDRKDIRIKNGRLGKHSVVLALLRQIGRDGTLPEASIWSKYTALKLVILAGNCSGVPFNNNGQDEILLGDVIINDLPVHYKFLENEGLIKSRQRRSGPEQLVEDFRKFFEIFHTDSGRDTLQQAATSFLGAAIRVGYSYPGADEDKLFQSSYRHKHYSLETCVCSDYHGGNDPLCEEAINSSCNDLGCDEQYLVARKRFTEQTIEDGYLPLVLHFGRVASVDKMKSSGEDRDRFAEAEGVIALEMEGVWRWEGVPCIMVKGVCDYADGHQGIKEKRRWQYFATARVAAVIKGLLERYPHMDGDRDRHVEETPRSHFIVPIGRNPNFTGREAILSRLLEKIQSDAMKDGHNRYVIIGREGVGKTQIALEAVHRLYDKNTDRSIFWVSATNQISLEMDYYNIGKQIKIEGIDKDDANVKELVKTALSEESSGSWLLVFDDADALGVGRLLGYLPFSRNGSILLTVRNPNAAVRLCMRLDIQDENLLSIGGLDIGEALSLAKKVLSENQTIYFYAKDTKRLFDFLRTSESKYEGENNWTKAEKREVGLLEILRKHLGDEHPETLSGMHNLVSIWEKQGRWHEAEGLAVRVLEIHEEILGAQSPGTLASMHSLASIYANQRRWSEAEKLYISVIETRKRIIGPHHPDTLASMHNLASMYQKLGRLNEAGMLEEQVLELYKMEPEADPDRVLASMHAAASIYKSQGLEEKAKEIDQQIRETLKRGFARLGQSSGAAEQDILIDADMAMLLDEEAKDSERESGYGSASRRAPTTVPSASGLRSDTDVTDAAMSPEKVEEEISTPAQSDDDVRSVMPEDDDIRSQTSDATTDEGMTGKALIRSFLAEQPQFRALCEKALTKMSRQRFIENMCRLLNSFHLWLTDEAKSEAEKAVAGLLRSKRGRRRVSEQLTAHIDLEHQEARDFDKRDLEISPLKMQDVENWISRAMRYSAAVSLEPVVDQNQDQDQEENQEKDLEEGQEEYQEEDQSSDAMEMDLEDTNEPYIFPYISDLRRFLLASKAFQSLLTRFALMFLSANLGDVLQSIPKENVWLSQEQDFSILNRFKTLVENATKVRWNWWPLSQRKRMLNPGESRLFWRCTCGVEQWEEISPEQREMVEKILDWSDNCPPLAPRCGVRKAQATILSSIKGILRYTGALVARPSIAATRYTPQEGSSPTLPESQQQHLARAVPHRLQQGPTISQQTLTQVTIPDATNNQQWWILLGIKGARRTLVPTQIHVTSQTTDSHIFLELKRYYRIYRGRLRLWFSVWRLDYCEVVKFNRLTPDRMVREHRDLPSDKDYHYDPRAGERDVRNPPISPHHFQTLFYACRSPCTWPFPHDCIPLIANTVNLARIPKRTREFERDQSSPIWGFETVFAVSFSYVLAYHLVMVAGPFIFWGVWLKFHPDDLQNASVPITVVIGGLSLFWSGAGILTSRERE
ncbi:hypothetical protein GGI35DRAFT_332667 [Trichoderma velutinum]